MKNIVINIFLLFTTFTSSAQDITGQWNGVLKTPATQLHIVFNITKTPNGFSTTMDSPDQGAKGIPVTTTTFSETKLILAITSAGISYEGEYKDGAITGTFKQGGITLPLNLLRDKIEKPVFKRPQEPAKPYPYYSEDIHFRNTKANITLAGTLTLPGNTGNYPVVVLITGSGPQNRDEELFGHKPFLVMSDYLTKNGIAVLRFDDRGIASSTGDFKTATSADFASDVESAVAYLKTRKEINKKKIGLLGHSEGGMIAPMIAAKSNDINFIVLLAGTGIPGNKLMLLQKEKIERQMGIDEAAVLKSQQIFNDAYQVILNQPDDSSLKNKVNACLQQGFSNKVPDEQVKLITDQILTPWMIYFLKYNPVPALEKVRCAVLAINGEKDVQVPAKENLAGIKQALENGRNKNFSIEAMPGLNHLFQQCTTGLPNEYATIEQTISPDALKIISAWIINQTK